MAPFVQSSAADLISASGRVISFASLILMSTVIIKLTTAIQARWQCLSDDTDGHAACIVFPLHSLPHS